MTNIIKPKTFEFNKKHYPKTQEFIKEFSRMLKDDAYQKIAEKISNNEYLSKRLVLHGGGALYLAYNSPRKTYDLDFSFYPSLSKEEIKQFELYFLKLKTKINKIKVKVDKIEQDSFRIKYFYEIEPSLNPVIKVEGKKARVLLPTNEVRLTLIGALKTEQPKEILADKILAIFGRLNERSSIKITDLYDIFYLLQIFVEKIELSFIEQKLNQESWRVPNFQKWPELYEKFLDIVKNSKTKIDKKLTTQIKRNYYEFFPFEKMLKTSLEFIESLIKQIKN